MKAEVKLNLDFQGYEGEVETVIINKVTDHLYDTLSKKTRKMIARKSVELLMEKLDQFILDTLAEFMDRQIQVTDSYGRIQETYENVDEILKEKFDKYITEFVDDSGKRQNSCSYGSKSKSRIEWMIEKKVNNMFDERIKTHFNVIERKITQIFNEKFNKASQEAIARTLANTVDIDKIIKG